MWPAPIKPSGTKSLMTPFTWQTPFHTHSPRGRPWERILESLHLVYSHLFSFAGLALYPFTVINRNYKLYLSITICWVLGTSLTLGVVLRTPQYIHSTKIDITCSVRSDDKEHYWTASHEIIHQAFVEHLACVIYHRSRKTENLVRHPKVLLLEEEAQTYSLCS